MEKEISSGAMLGIVLIALAAIIGIGFGIFAIAKNTANEGITNVQDSLTTVSESTFDDYNQKTVTGSAVRTALTNLSGKSYAILINTQAMDANQTTTTAHTAVLTFKGQSTGGYEVSWVNFNALLSTNGTDVAGKSFDAGAAFGKAKKANMSGNSAGDVALDLSDSNHMKFNSGVYTTNYTFVVKNGNVQFDTKIGSINTSGDCLQITDSTKFKANLIKDEAGVIKGIVFEQVIRQ